MREPLDLCRAAERGIMKEYRDGLWTPFIKAIKRYGLIREGDRVAVCISGGKDSMLMAKLFQELLRHTEIPFEARYLVMDPGYASENRRRIEENAALLRVPVEFYESNIFRVANRQEKNPCYLCARMRRGHLYNRAREMGCNKIALGHHMDDVIETTLMGMFYGSQLQAMPPMLRSTNFPGMELIRPMYMIRERDIIAWRDAYGLTFLQCACRFTERNGAEDGTGDSKRQEIKALLRRLEDEDANIPGNVFNALHTAWVNTLPGWRTSDGPVDFQTLYERRKP